MRKQKSKIKVQKYNVTIKNYKELTGVGVWGNLGWWLCHTIGGMKLGFYGQAMP